jgi:hypothetical protein
MLRGSVVEKSATRADSMARACDVGVHGLPLGYGPGRKVVGVSVKRFGLDFGYYSMKLQIHR